MKNIYKPKLDNTSEGYKAIIKILPNKIEKNSVYGTIKQPYFWLSEKAKRQAEIKEKRKLRIEKLNKLNEGRR